MSRLGLVERLHGALDAVRALPLAFRVYQRVRTLDPRTRRRNLSYRKRLPDGLPLPPDHLIMKVAGTPDIFVFLDGGERASTSIRTILRNHGVEPASLRSLLDFGCGCGRVLRWWKDLPATEIHGTDYAQELAQWCAANLPFARIGTNRLDPPTGYGDGQFDLVYALSVFTHFPENNQLDWIRELARILRPGGYLLISTHGAHYLPRLTEGERAQFQAGRLVVRHEKSAGSNLCSAFHPESYVRANFLKEFELVDFIPEGARGNPRQDAWLLRKRDATGK